MKARDARIEYKPLPNILGQDEIVLPVISDYLWLPFASLS